MVGGYALRYALDNSEVKSVMSIGRKKLGISHPKLKEVLHQNFADCSPLAKPTVKSGGGDLLPGDQHRVGIGRATAFHNRRLHDRVRAGFL